MLQFVTNLKETRGDKMLSRTDKIKAEMAIHDDTKVSLARKLDITTATLLRKLKGKYDWKAGELEKLAEIYGKDRTYFF